MKITAISILTSLALLRSSVTALSTNPPPRTNLVVLGVGSLEVRLITAKIAARFGDATCIVTGGEESKCRKLMYGSEYGKKGEDVPGNARPISKVEDLGEALGSATALAIVNDDPKNAFEKSKMDVLLGACSEKLTNVVLLSRMGVSESTSTGGGFFGFGGGAPVTLKQTEEDLRKLTDDKGVGLSIVRAGLLKGGGAGEVVDGKVVAGIDYGLDKSYYDTLFELEIAMATMAYDRFTLGGSLTRGDTMKYTNSQALFNPTKSSFDPVPTETSRTVAGLATVAAALHDRPIDFTVSSAKAKVPPSMDDMLRMINEL